MLHGKLAAVSRIAVSCLLAYSSFASERRFSIPPEAMVAIIGFGAEGAQADPNIQSYCEHFRLTPGQVRIFFRKAHPVTGMEIHDRYDWLPCYVDGTIKIKDNLYKWRIRPVGVGVLTFPDGTDKFFGCKSCGSSFE